MQAMTSRTPVIETPRLLLRGWRDADLAGWLRMNADPRVREFFYRAYDRDEDERRARERREQLERNGYGWWILEVKGDPEIAGVVVLQDVPFAAHFTPAFEIGWRLRFDAWGHGFATEAATAALSFAFDRLEKEEAVAFTAAVNVRSRRVMERLAMTYDPSDDFAHPLIEESHPLRPHVLYRIRREAFRARSFPQAISQV
jgi:RimJ/RimL family protein N-acetyltransferase